VPTWNKRKELGNSVEKMIRQCNKLAAFNVVMASSLIFITQKALVTGHGYTTQAMYV
jgi:hypothetical protein